MQERHWTETKDEGGMRAHGTQDVQVLGLDTLGILQFFWPGITQFMVGSDFSAHHLVLVGVVQALLSSLTFLTETL